MRYHDVLQSYIEFVFDFIVSSTRKYFSFKVSYTEYQNNLSFDKQIPLSYPTPRKV